MAGNIWEWVADWYDKDYYKASPVNDPTGPATGTLRILRGGSWFPNATFNRSAFRLEAKPEERQSGRGARIITLAVATP
jgi:formylglycine-generating enzyme required for sulfatase activity